MLAVGRPRCCNPMGSVVLALHDRHRHHGRIGVDGKTAAVRDRCCGPYTIAIVIIFILTIDLALAIVGPSVVVIIVIVMVIIIIAIVIAIVIIVSVVPFGIVCVLVHSSSASSA